MFSSDLDIKTGAMGEDLHRRGQKESLFFIAYSPETELLKHFNRCVSLTNLLYAYFDAKTCFKLEISKESNKTRKN